MSLVTVQAGVINDLWFSPTLPIPETGGEFRVFASQAFVSNDGTLVEPAPNAYVAVPFTYDNGTGILSFNSFQLYSTIDSLNNIQSATYTITLFSASLANGGIPLFDLRGFIGFFVPAAPTTTTLPAIAFANASAPGGFYDAAPAIRQIIGGFYSSVAFQPNDTTPSVINAYSFRTANTSTTNITTFRNGYNGQVIWVFINDTHTSIFGISRSLHQACQFQFGDDLVWHELTSGSLGIQTINGSPILTQLITIGVNAGVGNAPNIDSTTTPGTTVVNIPIATQTQIGTVTTDSQAFAGFKTFTNGVSVQGTLSSPSTVLGLSGVSEGLATQLLPNDTVTGTTNSRLAKLSAGGKAILATVADVDGIIGIVTAGGGTSGFCFIDTDGVGSCDCDGAFVIGHYAVPSIITDGKIHDAGATRPTDVQVIGRFMNSGGGAGVASILVYPQGIVYGGGGVLGSAEPAGIPAMLLGVSTPNQQILLYPANSSFVLSLTGSTAVAKVAATAQTDFLVKVNTITKATIRFAAGATVATIVSPISVTIHSGDVVEIIGPGSPDATLANVGFNLAGNVSVPASTDISIATTLIGLSTPSELVLTFPANSSFTLGVTGSTAVAKIAATAQTDFLIKVNGVTKGTLRFAIGGTVATVVSPTSTSIVSGDVIDIIGPATPDLTLANIGFNLKGNT